MGYFQPSALGPRCETSPSQNGSRARFPIQRLPNLAAVPSQYPTARACGTITLYGGWSIVAIYGQRMRLEPQCPRFDHRINSHL
jgi:hypothetical protein